MRVINSFIYPFIFICILWMIMIFQNITGMDPGRFGVYPRHVSGLIGILTMPLVHANYMHLMSNTLPLFILGAGIIFFYPEVALKVWVIIYLLTGTLVWLLARPDDHIGASGLIYGFATFLFFSGILRKNIRLMAISLLVSIFYGGIIWGALPGDPHISWEGHLFGAFSGVLTAFLYRHKGPKPKKYDWEEEDDSGHNPPHISHYHEVRP